MIDVIIPTMWVPANTLSSIQLYCQNPNVNKVIIIDNAVGQRPKNASQEILLDKKIQLVCYGKNIYVNPAWNEGFLRSQSPIIAIINDDITVQHDVFDMIVAQDLQDGDLVGVDLRGYHDNFRIDDVIHTEEEIVNLNYDRTKPIGGQAWAFGICMFMPRNTYNIIPSLYQIWYGDDYLAQRVKRIFVLRTNKIKGTISQTIKQFDGAYNDVSRRIEMDSKNLLRCGDFANGHDWDIPKNMIAMYQQQRERARPHRDIFQLEYEKARSIPSDINENLHVLHELAADCSSVVEMGVRAGVSTRAFLNSDVELLSFDLEKDPEVERLFDIARSQGKKVRYCIGDVTKIDVEPADMIFIDTFHVYQQLKQELQRHGNKAKKYLAFHDTYTFGLRGEDHQDQRGLLTAIIEFLIENPHWKIKIHKTNNNGMTVLERINFS